MEPNLSGQTFVKKDNNNDHVASGDTLSHQISGSVS